MITAFILGIMGSLHCAGMCGPLVLMTPVVGNTRGSFLAGRLVYHAGRISVYALIGILFGLIGESIVFAGFQRWISLITGLLLITAFVAATPLKARLTRFPVVIKNLFGSFLHKRTYRSVFALGAVNGLLPCGLVYMAATASIAAGSIPGSIARMIVFGLGTVPALLAISIAGRRHAAFKAPFLQKLAPIAIGVVALLLVIRAEPLSLFTNPGKAASCPACNER